MTTRMRALVQERYGTADVLHLADVPMPVVREGEVLIRVRAASLNAADVEYLRGDAVAQMPSPRRPSHRIPGSDVAGVVTEVGPGVTALAAGDEVFGDLFSDGFGACAPFVTARAVSLARKPAGLTFEQVVTLPQSGALAWQGLNEPRPVAAGERVLINGAGGGVGTFAVQLAAAAGAEVTAVDRATKEGLVRSLGAAHFLDFGATDYTRTGERYDLIVDVQARRSVGAMRRALRPEGRFGAVGGPILRLLAIEVGGRIVRRRSTQHVGLVIWRANDPAITAALLAAIQDGRMRPVIDSTWSLADAPEAFRRLAAGDVQGKAVIVMD